MKKRLLALFLAFVLVISSSVAVLGVGGKPGLPLSPSPRSAPIELCEEPTE